MHYNIYINKQKTDFYYRRERMKILNIKKCLLRAAIHIAVCSPLLIWSAPVRNIILCIGDGMGTEHVKAAHCYAGTNLVFEAFPYQSTMTTWSANSAVTDSGASGTAMATGVKVNNEVISLQIPGDGHELETLLEYFKKRGKATGLVATSYITHATPAVFGAHATNRQYYANIANDYLYQTKPNVLFGGGGYGMTETGAVAVGYTVIKNRDELLNLNTRNKEFVSGQFGSTHMPYEYDGLGNLPHLHEMTEKALRILDNDPDGFFLMVEGSRIDHAAHANDILRDINETLEFSRSVESVIDWMGERKDTLLLVTADHETGGLTVTNDNGAGNYPDVTWSTWQHTATQVPVYGIGLNSHLVTNVTDNTEIHCVATNSAVVPEVCAELYAGTNGFHVSWTSVSNYVYQIDSCSQLSITNWQPIATVTATTSRVSITDPAPIEPKRFYRIQAK